MLDHEADLVHVRREHDARRVDQARLPADYAADLVLFQCAEGLQVPAHQRPDLGLIAGDAVDLGEFFEKEFGAVHEGSFRVISAPGGARVSSLAHRGPAG